MPQYLRKARANEKLAKKLLAEGEFFDWVITAAFYSAIFYAYDAIFPHTDGRIYSSFDAYFSAKGKSQNKSKHRFSADLILQIYPDGSPYFDWLMDNCHSARYKDHITAQEDAEIAINYLDELKIELRKIT